MKKKVLVLTVCAFGAWASVFAQQAVVKEQSKTMKSYPFSDPSPVAYPSNLYYPYFRFDGFSAKGVNKEWKAVELENDYIRVTLFPEVGGKVWGAIDCLSQQCG